MKSFCLRALPVMAALIAAFGHAESAQAENYLCQQQFALCTSAPCIPEPGDPKVAICSCDVEDGPSLASVACDTVKPSTDANGIRTVYSQFALQAMATGQENFEMSVRYALDMVPQQALYGRSGQSQESHLCLRRGAHGRMDYGWRQLQPGDLQLRILVGGSTRCFFRRYRFPAEVPQAEEVAGDLVSCGQCAMTPERVKAALAAKT